MEGKMYYAKAGSTFSKIDAQKYGKRLSKLIDDNDGLINAEIVVKDAKKKSSPYHNYFEWDDTQAAREYRKEQARLLIRSIQIEVKTNLDGESFVRAFHIIDRTTDEKEKERGYAKFEYIQGEPDLYDKFILQKYLAEIRRINKEYSIYQELEPLTVSINEMLEKHLMEVA